ncbi:TRIC cation channel family protein [Candidatus Steffania adelgidicola]|uniref:TRIC cation channel family protein n=1 Tax=Candidatus Steffania adelgidicola TaxID=1076626 RepID=UPI001D03433E|nr:TRIC cation channel family protein [Candidatus Steffania adelgidicola]UDG80081.1 hypothetical protein GFK82_00639 [Candidatus Steffania adelgidicola]
MLYWFDVFGTGVFALSGVLLAEKLRMDLFGILVLAVVTAVGGGTIRDIILGNSPVFWIRDPTNLVVAILTCFFTLLIMRYNCQLPQWILPVLDAIGLAVFVSIGVNKAFSSGSGLLIAVCMGVITSVGGGMLRDILVREIPLVFHSEIYATASIAGGIVHAVAFSVSHFSLSVAAIMGMVTTLLIRLASIRWHLKLPIFEFTSHN